MVQGLSDSPEAFKVFKGNNKEMKNKGLERP